ncbi:MAG TPA: cation-transporting P-type ATPase [Verrucomicrobiae bacterium]|nr:cation-transporting P-type ATPase [Verrucomicrobiae bacterium]
MAPQAGGPRWHSLSVEQVLQELRTGRDGLTSDEATKRLAEVGRNEIARRKPVSPGSLLLKQFASFFVIVLLFAAALAFTVSFLPGESGRRLTAFFILTIVAMSVALSFIQEYRAQKQLEALDKLLVFKAEVIRNGVRHAVDAAEVVPGDLLVLTHGLKIPADARVIEAHSLRADESALTGESVGADKSPEPVTANAPLAEWSSMVFGSTYITYGAGLAVAVRTGMATEVGQIAGTLEQMTERPTPFQAEVGKMARQMTVLVGVLAALIAPFLLLVLHEPLVDVALNTLSLAVATIPESLPIVLIFALALGAREMARRKAVVRRLAVVESLGSVDTICTDKTGTLTQNVMSVQEVYADGQLVNAPQEKTDRPALLEVLRAGLLCNEASIEDGAKPEIIGDPVDTSLVRAALAAGVGIEAERASLPRVNEIPFSSERKMMTTIHRQDGGWLAYCKGAPANVLARCDSCWLGGQRLPLGDPRCQDVRRTCEQLQTGGMYVLATARKELSAPGPNDSVEQDMTFLGLVALMDPPHPEVAGSIAQAHGAGIRVVMITGDNELTARAIARQLGIGDRAVTSQELQALAPQSLRAQVKTIDIVARAAPATKQHVLQAFQDDGHFVAMTGDGVNDATALKQADVGVAMGLRGTDIAKESAAMVLLDDNFATITAAIEEGRRIFDNIRKFTNYLLSTSLGEVFSVLALSMFGYFPLSAKMLLWINVVTDVVPASALAADPAVPHVMKRRPRRHDEPILNKAIYATIAGSVLRTVVAYALLFWVGLKFGGVTYARTMLFTSIVLHAFTRVLVVRQLDDLTIWSNRSLLWSYLAAVALQLVALYTPLRSVFGVVALDWRAWAVMVPVVVASSLTGIYMTRWILKYIPLWETTDRSEQ